MWPVLVHALEQVDPLGEEWEFLLLCDPTAPVRSPVDVAAALERLRADPDADGIVSVGEPGFNVVWQSVVEEDGYMAHLVLEGERFTRRQDAPAVHYVDGSLYLWRTEFLRSGRSSWFDGRTLMHVVDSYGSIDTAEDLRRLEALVTAGVATLPVLARDAVDADAEPGLAVHDSFLRLVLRRELSPELSDAVGRGCGVLRDVVKCDQASWPYERRVHVEVLPDALA